MQMPPVEEDAPKRAALSGAALFSAPVLAEPWRVAGPCSPEAGACPLRESKGTEMPPKRVPLHREGAGKGLQRGNGCTQAV